VYTNLIYQFLRVKLLHGVYMVQVKRRQRQQQEVQEEWRDPVKRGLPWGRRISTI
jgi:hypothetical protein